MSQGSNVYRIIASSKQDASWEDAKKDSKNLEKDIADLAKKTGETIFFRVYEDPARVAHSSNHILLECSEKFVEEVKKLPDFSSVMLFPSDGGRFGIKTARRDESQSSKASTKKVSPRHI